MRLRLMSLSTLSNAAMRSKLSMLSANFSSPGTDRYYHPCPAYSLRDSTAALAQGIPTTRQFAIGRNRGVA